MARVVSSLFAEVADPGQVKHLGGQFQRPAMKAADVAGMLCIAETKGAAATGTEDFFGLVIAQLNRMVAGWTAHPADAVVRPRAGALGAVHGGVWCRFWEIVVG